MRLGQLSTSDTQWLPHLRFDFSENHAEVSLLEFASHPAIEDALHRLLVDEVIVRHSSKCVNVPAAMLHISMLQLISQNDATHSLMTLPTSSSPGTALSFCIFSLADSPRSIPKASVRASNALCDSATDLGCAGSAFEYWITRLMSGRTG